MFHIERELSKATSVKLASERTKAENQYLEASQKLEEKLEQKDQYINNQGIHNMAYFEQGIKQAQEVKLKAQKQFEEKVSNESKVKAAIKAISLAYHPYDLERGTILSPEKLETLLLQQFADIEQVALSAGLSDEAQKKIAKARKLVPQMSSTFTYFFQISKEIVESQSLTPQLQDLMYQGLIPAFYLKGVSEKLKDPMQKQSTLTTATIFLTLATSKHYPFHSLPNDQQLNLLTVAKDCSQLFQRSSSCVEGRNSQLSLRHHSFHRLSDSKLLALTTIHNFFIKRSDRSTAAHRFFGQKPRDLFSYLLDKVSFPARPAQKRSLLALAS